ncbi:MAG TPA: FAD:protein FMN transferase [Candidatus Limnocylindrales bacterium]|nr:FAD:protein FMN transferase [Candidatus Limnocylindrales bacterium]
MRSTDSRQAAPSANPVLERVADTFIGRFTAMASPCEVLVDTDDRDEAVSLASTAAAEARRIEEKFSRYRAGTVVDRINRSEGRPLAVDSETAGLLDYAAACHEESAGLFDITSGALRRVWTFDGGDRVPDDRAVRDVLRHVGWHRVLWDGTTLLLPAGMEIDLGGIGKEYAVDRAAALLADQSDRAVLVNFGGDLFASGPRRGGRPWIVGVDDPERTGEAALYKVELSGGALATTGDSRRFVVHRGRRLGHILDPRTGWPVADPPRSVTVVAGTCLEAGTLSTLAYLHGPGAENFLRAHGVQYRIVPRRAAA